MTLRSNPPVISPVPDGLVRRVHSLTQRMSRANAHWYPAYLDLCFDDFVERDSQGRSMLHPEMRRARDISRQRMTEKVNAEQCDIVLITRVSEGYLSSPYAITGVLINTGGRMQFDVRLKPYASEQTVREMLSEVKGKVAEYLNSVVSPPLRQNKALARSLAVEKRVMDALAQSSERGEMVSIYIPYEDFVFSTRDGKVYMPPSIQKGLDALDPLERRQGVYVDVLHKPNEGSFTVGLMRLVAPASDSATIYHEVLHLVQHVGQRLIARGQGRQGSDPAKYIYRDGKQVIAAVREHGKLRPYDTMDYGMPKKRSRTYHYRPAGGDQHRPDHAEHGKRDIEFLSNALTIAHETSMLSPRATAEQNAEYLNLTLMTGRPRSVSLFSPQRLKDFYTAMWGYAVERLEQAGAPVGKYPHTPTPAIYAILSGNKQPERDRVKKEMDAYKMKMERKRRKAAATPPPPAPPPVRPLKPVKPTKKAGGYTYKMDSTLGPRAFFIFLDGKPTGKYFFLEEKAQAFCAKQKAA